MEKDIRAVIRQLKQLPGVKDIYMFGSYISKSRKAKDIDLILKTDAKNIKELSSKIKRTLTSYQVPFQISEGRYRITDSCQQFYFDIVITSGDFLELLKKRKEAYVKL